MSGHLGAGSTDRLAQLHLQMLSMLIIGHYPAGSFMLIYLLETSQSQVTLTLLLLCIQSKPPSTGRGAPHLQQVQHARSHGALRRAYKLNADKREVQLIEVTYCEDTKPGHQLEASSIQDETK